MTFTHFFLHFRLAQQQHASLTFNITVSLHFFSVLSPCLSITSPLVPYRSLTDVVRLQASPSPQRIHINNIHIFGLDVNCSVHLPYDVRHNARSVSVKDSRTLFNGRWTTQRSCHMMTVQLDGCTRTTYGPVRYGAVRTPRGTGADHNSRTGQRELREAN